MGEDRTKQTGTEENGEYTAVVYFHGMGKQRRYEEVSRLIERLDEYQYHSHNDFNESVGSLVWIRPRLEPPSKKDGKDASYIRLFHKHEVGGKSVERQYRFHEVYWAPLTAGVATARGVVKWLASQYFTPLQALFAPWRSRHRLRRAAFHRLWIKRARRNPPVYSRSDYRSILHLFDQFEGLDARRDYPKGRFKQFLRFIETRMGKKPEKAQRGVSTYLCKRPLSS